MPEKRTAWLMSAGAGTMLIAGCFNLVFHATPSIFSPRVQTNLAAGSSAEEDDSCADTTELAMAMTAWSQTQQRGALAVERTSSVSTSGSETAPAG
jgi:hypothetical protein